MMTNRERQNLIKERLLQQTLTPNEFIQMWGLTTYDLKKYVTGKPYFDESKYLSFLVALSIDKNAIGYVEPKQEEPLKTPLDLLRPKEAKLNKPIKAFKGLFMNMRQRTTKVYREEALKNHLFERQFGYTIPFMYKYFFIGIALVFITNYLLAQMIVIDNVLLSFSIPFTLLLLVYELDYHDQLNLKDVFVLFVSGGIISIGVTFFIRNLTGYPDGMIGDIVTGFVEETAKLLTAMFLIRRVKFRNVYTAFVFGFAVGAGFDVFETMEYGINSILSSGVAITGTETLLTRSLFALGIGHHYWTGIIFATLIGLSKTNTIDFKKLYHPTFILVFIFISLYHAYFNYSGYLMQIVLAVMGAILFSYIGYQFYLRRFSVKEEPVFEVPLEDSFSYFN